MRKIMVFASHPDDDVLGCGGSIAKHTEQGHELTTVFMTSGEAGSLSCSIAELAVRREEEARQASAVLGVKDTVFLKNSDGFLVGMDSGAAMLAALECINELDEGFVVVVLADRGEKCLSTNLFDVPSDK